MGKGMFFVQLNSTSSWPECNPKELPHGCCMP